MKTILSFYINLLVFIISDVYAVKLIAGDRNVVKKNGTTHTISKYYIVPNDFDPKNVANDNSAEVSQRKSLRMNHKHHSKSEASQVKAANKKTNKNNNKVKYSNEISNDTVENNNVVVNDTVDSFSSGQNDVQDQAGEKRREMYYTSESAISVSTESNLESDNIGLHLLVEPLTKSINMSGNVTGNINNLFQSNNSRRFADFGNISTELNFDDELDTMILTKFGIAVHDSSVQNIEDFWKLVKFNMDRTSDDNELMAKIERLSQLLNIFTILYEAAKSHKHFESMIDSIIDILQIPFLIKRNTNEKKSKTYVSKDYDEDCLIKCQHKHFKPQVDSNGTYLTGFEGRIPSNDLVQENLNLQTEPTENSNSGYDLISPYNGQSVLEVTNDTKEDPGSNQQFPVSSDMDKDLNDLPTTTESIVADNQPINTKTRVIKSVVENSSPEITVIESVVEDKSPDSGETKPWINVYKSIGSLPSTVATLRTANIPWHIEDRTIDNLPWRIEDRTKGNLPWHIGDKTIDNLPWHIEDRTIDNLPWHIEDKTKGNLPWHIEDRTINNLPWHIEDRTIDNLPWHIEDKTKGNLPWHIEDRTKDNLPWHIENKKIKHLPWHNKHKIINHQPWTIKQRTNLPWTIEDRSIVKVPWNDVNNNFGHSPISLYQPGDPGVTTHNDKIRTGSNRPRLVHRFKNKIKKPYHIYTYIIKPDTRLYEKPNLGKNVHASRQPNSNLLTKLNGLSTSHGGHNVKFSPSYYESQTLSKPAIDISSQSGKSQLKHIEYVTPTYDTSNTVNAFDQLPDTPQDNNQSEYLVVTEIETNHKSEDLQPSEPEPNLDEDIEEHSVSKKVSSHSTVLYPNVISNPFQSLFLDRHGSLLTSNTSGKNPVFVKTEPNFNNSNINVNLIQHSNVSPSLDSTVLSDSNYENDKLVSGAQQPDFTTKASAYSEFTISNDDNNPLTYNNEDINQRPGFIPIVVDDNGKPSNVYSQNMPQHSGYATAHSEITNIPDDYNNPIATVSEETDQHPGLIPMVPYQPGYTNVVDVYDKLSNVYSQNMPQHSGYTTTTTAHSEITNIPNDYSIPPIDNNEDIDQRPDFVPVIPNHPEYVNVVDDSDEQTLIHGKNPSQHSGYTKKPSAHSEFTNIPDDYNNLIAASSEETDQHTGFISMVPYQPGYANVVNVYDKPSNVYSQNMPQHSGYTTTTTTHSEITNIPNDYSIPTTDNNEDIDQRPDFDPVIPNHPKYVNVVDDNEPTLIYGKNPSQHSGYTKKLSAHSEFTNIPDDYNDLIVASSEETDQHPGLIPMVPYQPGYANVVNVYDKPSNVYSQNMPQHSGYTTTTTTHSEITNIPNDYSIPTTDNNEDIDQRPDFDPVIPNHPKYVNVVDDNEPTLIYGKNPTQHPGYTTKISTHSEFANIPSNYNNPTAASSESIDQHPGFIPMVPYQPGYTNVVDVYDKPRNMYSQNTPQNSDYTTETTAHSEFTNIPSDYSGPIIDDNEDIDQRPDIVPMIPNYPEYTNIVDDYDEPTPIHGKIPSQHSGYTITIPNDYNNPTTASSEGIDQHPGFIPVVSYHPKYTNMEDNYEELNPVNDDLVPYHPEYLKVHGHDDKPIPVYYDEKTRQHPGYVAKSHSEFSTTNDYNNPTTGHEHAIYTHPGVILNVPDSPESINVQDDYDEPIPVYKEDTAVHPGWKVSSHSEYENSPYYNNNLRPDHEQDISTHPLLVHHVLNTPEYVNAQNNYGKLIPVYNGKTVQHPGWKVSSHSKYTNFPNHYNNYDEDDIDTRPESIDKLNDDNAQPTLVDDGPTENNNNPLTNHHYKHTVHTTMPSYVAYLHGNRPTKFSYLNHMKLKMAPTYKLLALDNLLKLHDAVTKTIRVSKTDYRAMNNLRKIINIILILAEKLSEPDDNNEWYMKIFYNDEKNHHPLHPYVYNLIRQRWLHELMLVLWKNNFDIHILQNPKMFSFLRSWQFPNYVQSFLEPEDLNDELNDEFSTQTYDDFLEEVPEDIENYVTNKVIQSYKAPNDGIVVSIAGVEVEPDANAIVNILQNYLHFKKFQQNVVIRDNKVEMLKQIILFLTQKGYDPKTIAELVYKLDSTVDLSEGKECQPHHPNFANKMYKVVLPVLRRSGW